MSRASGLARSRRRTRNAAARDHPLARPFARARVRMRALTVHRKPLAMTKPAVAPEVHQALDVHLHFAAQVAFDFVVGLEEVADLLDVVVRERLGELALRDARLLADLARLRRADPIEVPERDDDVLSVRKVDACNASHGSVPQLP